MASRKVGQVIYKHDLSPVLMIFRVQPEDGATFPAYKAGQYIALGRDDAKLTKKVGVDHDGRPVFAPDLDESGKQRVGPVMHSYSIASAPWETAEHGYLEFYVVQEMSGGVAGRLSTVLFGMPCCEDQHVNYVDRIVGSFTLEKLADAADRIVMIGTGTGLAPFASMVKQLHHNASRPDFVKRAYTLLHTNRTTSELGYHATLCELEATGAFDFLYVPTVSRPSARDDGDPTLGAGRATNVLRLILGLPMKEEEDISAAAAGTPERAAAEAALARTSRPGLPSRIDPSILRNRVSGSRTLILTCGNPASTADIQRTAQRVGVRAEVEPW